MRCVAVSDDRDEVGNAIDHAYQRLLDLIPWVLLAPATLISQLKSGLTLSDRAITLGIVAVAAAWVYFGYTRVPFDSRYEQRRMAIYFPGLILLFVALMSRDTVFLLFAITGFFHAYHLKPWPLGMLGVFASSVTVYGMSWDFSDVQLQDIAVLVGIVAVQTGAIGVGIVFMEKSEERDRQRDELVAKLQDALEENAGLHAQLLAQAREAGVLDERQRMAGEIHDTLAQGLAGIVTQMHAVQRKWSTPDEAREHVDRALSLAGDSLAEARRSVQALRPQELDDAQLPDALVDLTQKWEAGADGVALDLSVTGDRAPLSPAIEVVLFRVAQEALNNVAKHAKATRVGLTLSYAGDVVLLDVRDDGAGMAANGRTEGFGLDSMRQRVRSVGGSVQIESTPGEGTAVSASVPAIGMAA